MLSSGACPLVAPHSEYTHTHIGGLMNNIFDDNNLRKPRTPRAQVNQAEYLARHRTVDELLDERNYIKAQDGSVEADYAIIDQALKLKFS